MIVNELIEQGIYLESKSRYANGFFTNIGIPGAPWPASSFLPPPACSSVLSSPRHPFMLLDLTNLNKNVERSDTHGNGGRHEDGACPLDRPH